MPAAVGGRQARAWWMWLGAWEGSSTFVLDRAGRQARPSRLPPGFGPAGWVAAAGDRARYPPAVSASAGLKPARRKRVHVFGPRRPAGRPVSASRVVPAPPGRSLGYPGRSSAPPRAVCGTSVRGRRRRVACRQAGVLVCRCCGRAGDGYVSDAPRERSAAEWSGLRELPGRSERADRWATPEFGRGRCGRWRGGDGRRSRRGKRGRVVSLRTRFGRDGFGERVVVASVERLFG